MSKNKVLILSVIHQKLPVSEVARRYNVSASWVYRLVKQYNQIGEAAFQPRSKAPTTHPHAITAEIQTEILAIRQNLQSQGLDSGAQTIWFHLNGKYGAAPAVSTIWRCLRQHGLVVPDPSKKPKAYLQRFEADFPNETWQSDFTHVRLASGADIEILNFLDDHSRFLVSCKAHRPVTGMKVIQDFTAAINEFGPPQSTLTDNGSVFTARFVKGKNGFEHLLDSLGIVQKNSSPNHPQTQGKIERFHQTLKKWLASRPPARNLAELQKLLDEFRFVYNQKRPHRAIHGQTPYAAYTAKAKLRPSRQGRIGDWRTRFDKVDRFGKLSLRKAGKMHHLGVGVSYRGINVLMLISDEKVMVTNQATGEILSEHLIEPLKSYWPKQEAPGVYPGANRRDRGGQK